MQGNPPALPSRRHLPDANDRGEKAMTSTLESTRGTGQCPQTRRCRITVPNRLTRKQLDSSVAAQAGQPDLAPLDHWRGTCAPVAPTAQHSQKHALRVQGFPPSTIAEEPWRSPDRAPARRAGITGPRAGWSVRACPSARPAWLPSEQPARPRVCLRSCHLRSGRPAASRRRRNRARSASWSGLGRTASRVAGARRHRELGTATRLCQAQRAGTRAGPS
jgi:hypothetical protein